MPLAGLLEGFDKAGALYLSFRLSTKRESYFVGRQSDAVDIVLEHESISRRHAEFTVTRVGVLITDLNAAHGTFLKGSRLKSHVPTTLEDGAEIRFAGSSRRFRFRSPASVSADAALGGADGGWHGDLAGQQAARSAYAPPPSSLFPPPPLNEVLCKAVLYLLRAVKSDTSSSYHLRPDGFVSVEELIKSSALSTYHASIQDMDDLERAAIVGGQRLLERRDEGHVRFLRARSGHAPAVRVNIHLELRSLTMAELSQLDELVHATFFKCWNSIRDGGLAAMSAPAKRGVLCFATEVPARGTILTGMLKKPEVLVCVDPQAMLLDGMRFYRDSSNAIVCAGDGEGKVGLKYATRVLNATNGSHLLDEDELADERERAGVAVPVGPAKKPPVSLLAAQRTAQPEKALKAPSASANMPPPPSRVPAERKERFNPYAAHLPTPKPVKRVEEEDSDEEVGESAAAVSLRAVTARKKYARGWRPERTGGHHPACAILGQIIGP
eukprot:CAMPEP_0179919170 /NCGR_PEP_ID=MMETSP0983-20121128/3771_1 /TAXON_ID=483367 /ORGANISM="non described non described, Strain CCMP 2436" /LENGTH=496 /DNA_ID=CAMNT_0021822049 /DNA_START=38 /DNA_END=1526 /DNA_ORIENTATION=+